MEVLSTRKQCSHSPLELSINLINNEVTDYMKNQFYINYSITNITSYGKVDVIREREVTLGDTQC